MPPEPGDCCAPPRPTGLEAHATAPVARGGRLHDVVQVALDGGVFLMGDAYGDGNPQDGEAPVHEVELASFEIDATSVTNTAYAAFVTDTGYATEAERFGYSAVFHLMVAADADDIMSRATGAPWWLGVRGASWRRPFGRRSDLDGLDDHPVVHVSWNDAMAYCRWSGRRLPTEAEWEFASRGGLAGARYPWGDRLLRDGRWPANIWQGTFPSENTGDDGWMATAPVSSFEPNEFGLWQTVGNVWEWCADWFDPNYYRRSPRYAPGGPDHGNGRVIRGGSYLCHDSYCNRYRNSARSSNTPDSSTGNTGFRTVRAAGEG